MKGVLGTITTRMVAALEVEVVATEAVAVTVEAAGMVAAVEEVGVEPATNVEAPATGLINALISRVLLHEYVG